MRHDSCYLALCSRTSHLVKASPLATNSSFYSQLWAPSIFSLVNAKYLPFHLWLLITLNNITKPLGGRSYAFFLFYRGQLVHRCIVTRRSHRFAFMGDSDIQIGATYTPPQYRGNGYASLAISLLAQAFPEALSVWYVSAADNYPSIKAATKAGLVQVFHLRKTTILGVSFLGRYIPLGCGQPLTDTFL